MHAHTRQLLCLLLAAVLALLPVSGPLLAAMADGDAPGHPEAHLHAGHHGTVTHAVDHHEGEMHGPNADSDAALAMQDCANVLCGGPCSGCSGCHAPPTRAGAQAAGAPILTSLPSPLRATPPPGVVFRPPISASA